MKSPTAERTLVGTLLPTETRAQLPERTELQAVRRDDGSISVLTRPVRDHVVVNRSPVYGDEAGERLIVPEASGRDIVAAIVEANGADAVGEPYLRRRERTLLARLGPLRAATAFAGDALASFVEHNRVTRVRLNPRMGATQAVEMLLAMFPNEGLTVYCHSRHLADDLLKDLASRGVTATDRFSTSARVVLSRYDGFLKPHGTAHRRIVAVMNESNVTTYLTADLSLLTPQSRLILFTSQRSVETQDDRARLASWFGEVVHDRHTAGTAARPIRGTFAVLRDSSSPRGRRHYATPGKALRRRVIHDTRFLETVGRLVDADPCNWLRQLRRCDKDLVTSMTGPVVIVASTLQHAVNLLAHSQRAIVRCSAVGAAKQHMPALQHRILRATGRSVPASLSAFGDRVIVPLADFHHLRDVGAILRVDSLSGGLPISDRQLVRWSTDGVTDPLHVVDLLRPDFDVGRLNMAARAAEYAAAGLNFAHAPKFDEHRRPPVRYIVGTQYGRQYPVYHRRAQVERE